MNLHSASSQQTNSQRIRANMAQLPPTNTAVQLVNFSFSFGPEAPKIIENINLEVPRGSTTLLIGANGAGKSSLLRLLAGKTLTKDHIGVLGKHPFFEGNQVERELMKQQRQKLENIGKNEYFTVKKMDETEKDMETAISKMIGEAETIELLKGVDIEAVTREQQSPVILDKAHDEDMSVLAKQRKVMTALTNTIEKIQDEIDKTSLHIQDLQEFQLSSGANEQEALMQTLKAEAHAKVSTRLLELEKIQKRHDASVRAAGTRRERILAQLEAKANEEQLKGLKIDRLTIINRNKELTRKVAILQSEWKTLDILVTNLEQESIKLINRVHELDWNLMYGTTTITELEQEDDNDYSNEMADKFLLQGQNSSFLEVQKSENWVTRVLPPVIKSPLPPPPPLSTTPTAGEGVPSSAFYSNSQAIQYRHHSHLKIFNVDNAVNQVLARQQEWQNDDLLNFGVIGTQWNKNKRKNKQHFLATNTADNTQQQNRAAKNSVDFQNITTSSLSSSISSSCASSPINQSIRNLAKLEALGPESEFFAQ
ncbi:CCR4-NOT regulatory complex component [Physocladia obscura]|uniref:CCR4-NOT regulatory complex component n=1 Tax=Physocladia obscura TaxID=109957 RepID=A0AAD5XIE7_9FUNG|nr:CCR4-NOT regulatory complex component [Physocladia obscura]